MMLNYDWGIIDLIAMVTQTVVLSSTAYWDHELRLPELGLLLQLKCFDPENPFAGGQAHFKLNGQQALHGMEDVDLDMIYDSYGNNTDGLFDINLQYRFLQKADDGTDRLQEGYFTLYRTLEEGRWKTMMTLQNDNWSRRPFIVLALKSDWRTFMSWYLALDGQTWQGKVEEGKAGKVVVAAQVPGLQGKVVGEVWGGASPGLKLEAGDNKVQASLDRTFSSGQLVVTRSNATVVHLSLQEVGDLLGWAQHGHSMGLSLQEVGDLLRRAQHGHRITYKLPGYQGDVTFHSMELEIEGGRYNVMKVKCTWRSKGVVLVDAGFDIETSLVSVVGHVKWADPWTSKHGWLYKVVLKMKEGTRKVHFHQELNSIFSQHISSNIPYIKERRMKSVCDTSEHALQTNGFYNSSMANASWHLIYSPVDGIELDAAFSSENTLVEVKANATMVRVGTSIAGVEELVGEKDEGGWVFNRNGEAIAQLNFLSGGAKLLMHLPDNHTAEVTATQPGIGTTVTRTEPANQTSAGMPNISTMSTSIFQDPNSTIIVDKDFSPSVVVVTRWPGGWMAGELSWRLAPDTFTWESKVEGTAPKVGNFTFERCLTWAETGVRVTGRDWLTWGPLTHIYSVAEVVVAPALEVAVWAGREGDRGWGWRVAGDGAHDYTHGTEPAFGGARGPGCCFVG